MWTPDIDPLEDLREAQIAIEEHGNLINKLIVAHNELDKHLVNLAHQNAELAKLHTQQANLLSILKREIENLKQ